MSTFNHESPEHHFEATLFELKKQYQTYRDTLESLGYFLDKTEALEADPTLEHTRVILGIDGREYPFPSFADIQRSLTKDKETKDFYTEQFRRGFTHLHITPFALSINTHLHILKQALLREYNKNGGHIYSAAEGVPQDATVAQLESTPDLEFPLNPDGPLSQWSEYQDADTNGNMVYFPTAFTAENHGGQTKQQLLDHQRQQQSPFCGYLLSFTHAIQREIPRQGKTKSQHTLEAGQSPNDYLALFQQAQADTNHLQHGQRGQTIEEALTLMATTLEHTHQLIDDYIKHGSLNYTTGTWFPRSGGVGDVYAGRVDGRVYVDRHDPLNRVAARGSRSAVGRY